MRKTIDHITNNCYYIKSSSSERHNNHKHFLKTSKKVVDKKIKRCYDIKVAARERQQIEL